MRNFAYIALIALALAACKSEQESPETKEKLRVAREKQVAQLNGAASKMVDAFPQAVAGIEVQGANFVEIRKRDAYAAEAKRFGAEYCRFLGEQRPDGEIFKTLPGGSVRVQIYDEGRRELLGNAYCYDDSGESEKLQSKSTWD